MQARMQVSWARTPLLISLLFAGGLSGQDAATRIPAGYQEVVARNPAFKKGLRVHLGRTGSTSGPGLILLATPRGQKRSTFGEHGDALFPSPSGIRHALQICLWRHWGHLVKSEKEFASILALYRKAGLELEASGGRRLHACELFPVERRFGFELKEDDEGFRVGFTAFTLPPGMGARALLARWSYALDRAGRVVTQKKTVYLEGPGLNWQTAAFMEDDPARMKRAAAEDRKLRDMRERVIVGVRDVCKTRLPPGRPAPLRQVDCVNGRCPFSGGPVRADALVLDRGKVVGFCSPGCRDKFAADPGKFRSLVPELER